MVNISVVYIISLKCIPYEQHIAVYVSAFESFTMKLKNDKDNIGHKLVYE